MESKEYDLLLNISVKIASIEEQIKHVPSKEEFTAFKTKIFTIGSCITSIAGFAMWFLG